MEVAAHGFDTLRPKWELEEPLPITDKGWQTEMLSAGFEDFTKRRLDPMTGEVVEAVSWRYQDTDNSTLRYFLTGGRYLSAEFSAPRLLDNSPINLRLASDQEAREVVEEVSARARRLIPDADALTLQKFGRADYAVDLHAGDDLPGVLAAGAQFRLVGARKVNRTIHPNEGATIRSPQQTMRFYDKPRELLSKLNRREREEHANIIQLATEKGLTRMEHMSRPRGGLATDCTDGGAAAFAKHLESGFPGGRVVIGGLEKLRADIDALDISTKRKSTLMAFVMRYATLGEDGMMSAYSRRTFYRNRKQFLEHGLCLNDITTYEGEVDFNPVIKLLRAA